MTTTERLLALEAFGIKLGLDNMRTLVAALGHPERAYPTIHIAGTNGKGSVSAMVERALRAAGHRTGLYTSPHLDRIEERVAIDGAPVDEATFEACARDVLAMVDAAPRRWTPDRQPDVLRGHHGGGVRGVPPRAGRRRGDRSRARRPLRCDHR